MVSIFCSMVMGKKHELFLLNMQYHIPSCCKSCDLSNSFRFSYSGFSQKTWNSSAKQGRAWGLYSQHHVIVLYMWISAFSGRWRRFPSSMNLTVSCNYENANLRSSKIPCLPLTCPVIPSKGCFPNEYISHKRTPKLHTSLKMDDKITKLIFLQLDLACHF